MDELVISIQPRSDTTPGTTVLSVIGPLTHGNAPSLRQHLRDALDGTPRLLVDLRCCTDIDLDGLLALSVAQHAARTRGGDLQLVEVPRMIRRQIRQHNLHELLDEGR
jgi:anti-anti-sigma factor